MARLPNADRAIIDPRKITDYLLAPAHEQGGPKARFFISFGWSPDAPAAFAEDLRAHAMAQDLDRTYPAEHGTKYEIIGPIQAPNGSVVHIRAVWIILHEEEAPRLITAVPA